MPSQAAIRIAKGLRAHADARPVIPCLISSSDSANRNDRIRHVGTTANRELADSGWQSGRSEGKFSRPTRAIRGRDICDGRVSVKRLKKSRPTLHALRIDSDPLFDESPLLELAKASPRPNCFRGHANTWMFCSNDMLPSRAFTQQNG